MRTYDPADRILYVHMAPEPPAHATPSDMGRSCSRLPAGYANQSLQARLEGPPRRRADLAAAAVAGHPPLLVVIPGGAGTVTGTAPSLAPPALRLA